jgi:hypothetical protein
MNERLRGATDLQSYNEFLKDNLNYLLPYDGGAFKRAGFKTLNTIAASNKYVAITVTLPDYGPMAFIFSQNKLTIYDGTGAFVLLSADGSTPTPFRDPSVLSFALRKRTLLINHPDLGLFEYTIPLTMGAPWADFPTANRNFSFAPVMKNQYPRFMKLKCVGDGAPLNGQPTDIVLTPEDINNPANILSDLMLNTSGFCEDDVGKYLIIDTEEGDAAISKHYTILITATRLDVVTSGQTIRSAIGHLVWNLSDEKQLPEEEDESRSNWNRGFANYWTPAVGRQITDGQMYRGFFNSIAFYEGRLVMAGHKFYSDKVVVSSTHYADYLNFMPGPLTSDGLILNFSYKSATDVKWLFSGAKLFCADSEYAYVFQSPQGHTQGMVPETKTMQFYRGAISNVKPEQIDETWFFAGDGGKSLHEVILDGQSMTYSALTTSLTADDLLWGDITSMAWQHFPNRMLWLTTKTGELISVTYLRDSGIVSFSHHKLGGDSKALCCLVMGLGDEQRLYAVVLRRVGPKDVYTLERMSPHIGQLEKGIEFSCDYLDSSVQNTNAFQITNVDSAVTDEMDFAVGKTDYDDEILMFPILDDDVEFPKTAFCSNDPFVGIKFNQVNEVNPETGYKIYRRVNDQNFKIDIEGAEDAHSDENFNCYRKFATVVRVYEGKLSCSSREEFQIADKVIFYGSNLETIDPETGEAKSLNYDKETNRIPYMISDITDDGLELLGVDISENLNVYGYVYLYRDGDARFKGLYTAGQPSKFTIKVINDVYPNPDDNVKLCLSRDDSDLNLKEYFVRKVYDLDAGSKIITLYDRSFDLGLEYITLNNENVVYSKLDAYLGEIYAPVTTIDASSCPWYFGTTLALTINGYYVGKITLDDEGKADLSAFYDDRYGTAFSAVVGYVYNDKLDFPPFQGGNAIGGTHGSQGQIKSVVLSVYKSRFCFLGVNSGGFTKVDYPKNPQDFIYSGDVKCLPMHSGSFTDRALSIRSNQGEPFNLTAATLYCWVADN